MGSISPVVALGACAIAAGAVCGGALLTGAVKAPEALTLSAPAEPPLSYPQAVRLAKQATFGPSAPLVVHMVATGLSPWLDEQFAATGSSYADLARLTVPRNYCKGKTGAERTACNRDYLSATPVAMRFYADAANRDDQLRQRVAWALSQLLVASDVQVHTTAGVAALNQIFLDNAFGNYRDILKAVTLNPYMGDYLDLADSNRTAPSENYARELMQLFSLGVNQLEADGTIKRDAAGAPLATYSSADVHEVARALTGWTYARLDGASTADTNNLDYSSPMVPFPGRYDTGAKSFLGRTVPANASQEASLDAVMDAVFNHANTAPYLSRRLIQQLVISNPSPAYVGRVSLVFADDGSGVRGNLKAVVRAILTDPEARGAGPNVAAEGKVKEPVLLELGLARAIGMETDGYAFTTRDAAPGQQPFRAPSVFNFYPPDFPLPLGGNVLSPSSKLLTTATVVARHNFVYDWTITGDADKRKEFAPLATIAGATGTLPLWAGWETLDLDAQLDRVNLLLLEYGLTAPQRAAMRAAMLATTDRDPVVQARRRAQVALYVAASSPLFQIDR